MTTYFANFSAGARRNTPFVPLPIATGLCKVMDVALIVLAIYAAQRFLGWRGGDAELDGDRYYLIALIACALFVGITQKLRGYSVTNLSRLGFQLLQVTAIWLGIQLFGVLEMYLTNSNDNYSPEFLIAWSMSAWLLLCLSRFGMANLFKYWRQIGAACRDVVVVGAGDTGAHVIENLKADPLNYRILGIFDDRIKRTPPHLGDIPLLGSVEDLVKFARVELPTEIIVTLPITKSNRLGEILRHLTLLPVDLRLTCDINVPGFKLHTMSHIGDMPTIDILHRPLKDWSAVFKWFEDKIASGLILLLASPLLLLIALLIKLDSPGPLFFRQARYGFNNRVINVLKFRSMYVDKGDVTGAARTQRGDARVTRVGRILRAFSLDEIPQLINVLRGDMSLVGPRAHAVAMKVGEKLYNDSIEEYFARHRVKPGLTGWAQVHGLRGEIRDEDAAAKRVKYDLEYIDTWSPWLDIKIIFKSVIVVLFERENAY